MLNRPGGGMTFRNNLPDDQWVGGGTVRQPGLQGLSALHEFHALGCYSRNRYSYEAGHRLSWSWAVKCPRSSVIEGLLQSLHAEM